MFSRENDQIDLREPIVEVLLKELKMERSWKRSIIIAEAASQKV